MTAPLFSIVTPVYNPPLDVLSRRCVGPRPELRRLGADPGRRLLSRPAVRELLRRPPPTTRASGSSSGRPTVTSWRRPTTASRPPRRVPRPARPRRPARRRGAVAEGRGDRASTPTSTTSTPTRTRSTTTAASTTVPQARLVAGAAARPDVHLSPLGAPHLGGARGRRVPRGVRRLAGPRPRAAGRPSGRAESCTSPRSSTTGVWSRARRPVTPTPSRTPRSPGRNAVQDHLDRLGIDARGRATARAPGIYASQRRPRPRPSR